MSTANWRSEFGKGSGEDEPNFNKLALKIDDGRRKSTGRPSNGVGIVNV
jgi:hypothetical protein